MKTIKQSIGIDISKSTFTSCICYGKESGTFGYSQIKTFKNDKIGFNQLIRWVRKQGSKNIRTVFILEATGVYYESLAYFLDRINQTVHVVLPNTSKHYFASLNVKTKTDAVDAKVLSRFGAERNHKQWIAPNPLFLELRNLTRYHLQLQEQKTSLNNIKHSKEAAHEVQKFIIQSNKKLIAQIDKQIELCKLRVESLTKSDKYLKSKIDKIITIKGLGLMTIATIVSETLGFVHVKNIKQLTSYAGYDVVQRESGSSVKGKTRISKKGNRYIRNALFFPALVASRHNLELKQVYQRLVDKKGIKMVGQVAIQRKLLILIYTLWEKDMEYIEGYKRM